MVIDPLSWIITTLLIIVTLMLGQWLFARLFDYIEVRAHLLRDKRKKDKEDRPIIDSSEDPDDYIDIYENV